MEYIKGQPYFSLTEKKINKYDYLDCDFSCELLIIGGGVDGAVANYFLSQNHDVALVDSSRLATGCTSRATSLLEYQLDDFAKELKGFLSEKDILDIYMAGLYGIEKLGTLVKSLGKECFFSQRPSLLYSNRVFDRNKILNEAKFRKDNKLQCEIITKNNNFFNFNIDMGLYCENGGGEVDPYLFSKALIEGSKNQDLIFENTQINSIEKLAKGYKCTTSFGNKIFCKEVILATGFNFDLSKDAEKICDRTISYSIVTNPLKELRWFRNCLVQDCLDPYHYIRFLSDDRLILGGEDTPLKDKISQDKAQKKYDKLLKHLKSMFPSCEKEIISEYTFCGAFGSTNNNLGIVGKDKNGVIDFFSCGANGIVNSMIGIEIIDDILKGKKNRFEEIFSPLRK